MATVSTFPLCWPCRRPAGWQPDTLNHGQDGPPCPFTSGRGPVMLLRHATLLRNLPSIQRHGLLGSRSQGKLPAVWLHAASKSAWAAVHTVQRHGGKIESV